MKNYWHITDEQREKFIPILKEYFNKLENMTEEEVCNTENEDMELDLTYEAIGPYLLRDLLREEFGYKEGDWDINGWEMDLWINMYRTDGKTFPSMCEHMVIQGCGMTYGLCLVPYEFQ